jgi:hypothetical protein
MRLALLLVVLSLPFLVGPAVAGEGDAPGVEDLAHRFMSEDPEERASAEKEIAAAAADLLREVLRHVREDEEDGGHDGHDGAPAKGPLVRMEARFLTASAKVAGDLGMADAAGRGRPRLLSAEEEKRLLDAVASGSDVHQVTAPQLTTYDRQKANINVLSQTSYVKDFDLQVQGQATIADPVVGTVATGATLEVTPQVSPDGREVLVDLELALSDLTRPIEEHALAVGGATVRVQLPEVRTWKLERRVAVPSGRTMLLDGPAALAPLEGSLGPRHERFLILLTAEVIPGEFVPVPSKPRELPDGPSKDR